MRKKFIASNAMCTGALSYLKMKNLFNPTYDGQKLL